MTKLNELGVTEAELRLAREYIYDRTDSYICYAIARARTGQQYRGREPDGTYPEQFCDWGYAVHEVHYYSGWGRTRTHRLHILDLLLDQKVQEAEDYIRQIGLTGIG